MQLNLRRFLNLPKEPVSPLVSTTKSAGKPTTPPSRPGPKARIRESLYGPTLTENGLFGMCTPP